MLRWVRASALWLAAGMMGIVTAGCSDQPPTGGSRTSDDGDGRQVGCGTQQPERTIARLRAPAKLDLHPGESTTCTVTIEPEAGFDGRVTLIALLDGPLEGVSLPESTLQIELGAQDGGKVRSHTVQVVLETAADAPPAAGRLRLEARPWNEVGSLEGPPVVRVSLPPRLIIEPITVDLTVVPTREGQALPRKGL